MVVGRGGREHALAWKLAGSAAVGEVFAAPGSVGMARVATPVDVDEGDFDSLAGFAKSRAIDLTIVGPEAPLVNGIADRFAREGLSVFAPTASAAVIEGSKSFAKGLMERHGIPTAAHEVFDDFDGATAFVDSAAIPVVIKADGLAAGKGVVIAQSRDEARAALREMMVEGRFAGAGRTVVIEEFLEGEEFSLMALVNGGTVVVMEPARDYKRAGDGDSGPNTGGMGAYSPVPQIGAETLEAAAGIIRRTAAAMEAEGRPFRGFLYAGLIATAGGPKVIEFNARLGDPETQVLLPRLETDLFEAISAVSGGRECVLRWSGDAAVAVVLASRGYPGDFRSGVPISGLDGTELDPPIFHCGTEFADGRFLSKGGRVLAAVGKAETLAAARDRAYLAAAGVGCDGLFFRRDIGSGF